MNKYINPFIDWSFKRIFGTENVKDILIGFLNALFEGEHVITDITYLNNELKPEKVEGKTILYDLYCLTDKGEYIIVEMQNKDEHNFKDRSLYYVSRCIYEQGTRGDGWNYKLHPVYGIFFLNFKLDRSKVKDVHQSRTEVVLADRDTGEQFSDKFKEIFIELPRFNKTESECESSYDQWIYILKNLETMDVIPFTERNAIFSRLEETASRLNMNEDERVQYNDELKKYRDYFNQMDFAKESGLQEGYNQGREDGRAEGRAEGRIEGRAEGRVEGRAEGIIESARKMIAAGTPEDIVLFTLGVRREDL